MDDFREINRGPRRARRRELMQRGASVHDDGDEDMRSSLDAARQAALTSFSAQAMSTLTQIGKSVMQLL
jgi:hypothetical protein